MEGLLEVNSPIVIAIGLFGLFLIVSANFAWKILDKVKTRNGNGKLTSAMDTIAATQQALMEHAKSEEHRQERREFLDTIKDLRHSIDALTETQALSRNAILEAVRVVDEKVS